MEQNKISFFKKIIFYIITIIFLIIIGISLNHLKNFYKSTQLKSKKDDKFFNQIVKSDNFPINIEKFPLNSSKYDSPSRHLSYYGENMYNIDNLTFGECKRLLIDIRRVLNDGNKDEEIVFFRTNNIDLGKSRVLNKNNIISGKKYINKIGTRNKKIDKKKDNEIRIVLLGGSTTINNSYLNSSSEYMSFYLNKYLRSINSPKIVNVINGGMAGTRLVENYHFFREQLLQLSPDIVLFKESANNINNKILLSEIKLNQLIKNNNLTLYEEFIPKFIELSKKNDFIFMTADMPINFNLIESFENGKEKFWDGYSYHSPKRPEFLLKELYPFLDLENFRNLYFEIQKYFVNLSKKYNYNHLKILKYFSDKKGMFGDLVHKTELGLNYEGYIIANKLIEEINLNEIMINKDNLEFKNIYDDLTLITVDSSFNCKELN
tara:strand:- start:1585 stop:2886 length:1302 start_codon:yes stop_codon:yes gene_type:complete